MTTPPPDSQRGARRARRARRRARRRAPGAPTAVVALATAVAAIVLGLGGCGGGSTPVATITQVAGPSQVDARYPGATVLPRSYPMPDVTLTDTSGQPFDLATRTRGRVTLLYFGYTHCPDVCPINMALAARAVHRLDAEQRAGLDVVFVTTDPARDTPPVIRTWLDAFDPGFIGLTGSLAQVHGAEGALGMPLSFATRSESPAAGAYEVVHAGYVLAYDRAGQARLQFGDNVTATEYSTSLAHLLTAAAR